MWSSRRNRENIDKNHSVATLTTAVTAEETSVERAIEGTLETPLDGLDCETNLSQSLICLALLSRPSVSICLSTYLPIARSH